MPVLRPLAERLVDLARPRPGDLLLDAPGGGGVLLAALGRAARGRARVVAVAAGARTAEDASEAARGPGVGPAWTLRAEPAMPPLRAGTVDIVASLLTLAHEPDPGATLAALARLLRPGGRLLAMTWAGPDAAPHLAALRSVLRLATGGRSAFLDATLGLGDERRLLALATRAGLVGRVEHLRDVVRFDGIDHLWAAHCGEGPLAVELDGVPLAVQLAARDGLATRLLAVTAWDGTLVVPVGGLVLSAATAAQA